MYDSHEQEQNTWNNHDSARRESGSSQPVSPSYGSTAQTQWNGSTYHGAGTGGSAWNGAAYTDPRQSASSSAYTWGPQGQPAAQNHYYAPVRPVKQKQKRHVGRFLARALAVVLTCSVISMGSVGAFAWMVRSGYIRLQSESQAEERESSNPAFTLYKQAESSPSSSVTVTTAGETLTAQEIAAKVTPSVVLIQNYQYVSRQSGYSFFGFGWYADDDDAGTLTSVGEGSGIIISEDGYIVTNQHVVEGAVSLKVVTSTGVTYEAVLIGEDTQTDLAVIKVTTDDVLTAAEFGSSSDLQVADDVMAIGNPGGSMLSSSVTFGKVSALDRPVTNSDTGYTVKCIQTDAAINPGNSGGALVDYNGYVVGVNSSKIAATEYEGLGFAIPSDTVQPIVSDLIEYGYVKDRAALGFSCEYIDSLTARWYGMSSGCYITEVTSEEAREAGLQRGDLITAIDDTQVVGESTLNTYIATKKPGDAVTLTVARSLRGGGSQTVTLTMTLPENTGKSVADRSYSYSF